MLASVIRFANNATWPDQTGGTPSVSTPSPLRNHGGYAVSNWGIVFLAILLSFFLSAS